MLLSERDVCGRMPCRRAVGLKRPGDDMGVLSAVRSGRGTGEGS